MANNRFNKKVTPKGYKMGGRVKKMGGGMMMMKRPMMKDGSKLKSLPKGLRKDTTTSAYGDAGKGRPVPKYRAEPYRAETPKGNKAKRKKMMGGSSLKPVDPKTQKGLSKLPTKVRNKMGFMKKGGKVK